VQILCCGRDRSEAGLGVRVEGGVGDAVQARLKARGSVLGEGQRLPVRNVPQTTLGGPVGRAARTWGSCGALPSQREWD
jgi:hypothetical protein